MPEQTNDYFITVAAQGQSNSKEWLNFYDKHRINNEIIFSFGKTTDENIREFLKNLKSNVASVDNVKLKILTLILPHCIQKVKYMFNKCSNILFKCVLPVPKVPAPKGLNELEYQNSNKSLNFLHHQQQHALVWCV